MGPTISLRDSKAGTCSLLGLSLSLYLFSLCLSSLHLLSLSLSSLFHPPLPLPSISPSLHLYISLLFTGIEVGIESTQPHKMVPTNTRTKEMNNLDNTYEAPKQFLTNNKSKSKWIIFTFSLIMNLLIILSIFKSFFFFFLLLIQNTIGDIDF